MIARILTSGILREPRVLAVCSFAFALPIVVTLYLASALVDLQNTRNLQSIADRLTLWADENIEETDKIIQRRLVTHPQGCPPFYVDELARTVFDNGNISALGIIRDGKVICAHSRLQAKSLLGDPKIADIPPDKTVISFTPDDAAYHTPAVLVARRIDAQTVGLALIEPKYFLLPLSFIPNGNTLQAALIGPNGEVYAGDSSFIGHGDPDLAKRQSNAQFAIARSTRFPISIAVHSDPRYDRMQWRGILPYALAGGLLLGLSSSSLVAASFMRSRSIPSQLRTALARHELFIEYLPTIDLATNRCVGAEALLRWNHPDHGLIRPDVFIPIAETSGLIGPITEWVLSEVAADLETLSKLALPADFHLGINLTSQDISDHIVSTAQRVFSARNVSFSHVMFELSERRLIEHAEKPVQDLIKRLRQLGAKIALDDFGTGSSNLAYLQSFEIDYLKIEKQFIDTLGPGSISSALVTMISEMGKHLNVTVIAEGIENEKQLALVKSFGVQQGQGWKFSKPLRFPAFLAWLQKKMANDAA